MKSGSMMRSTLMILLKFALAIWGSLWFTQILVLFFLFLWKLSLKFWYWSYRWLWVVWAFWQYSSYSWMWDIFLFICVFFSFFHPIIFSIRSFNSLAKFISKYFFLCYCKWNCILCFFFRYFLLLLWLQRLPVGVCSHTILDC